MLHGLALAAAPLIPALRLATSSALGLFPTSEALAAGYGFYAWLAGTLLLSAILPYVGLGGVPLPWSAAHYLLLTTCYLLLATYYLLLTTYHSLLSAYYLQLITYYVLCSMYYVGSSK